MLNTIQNSAPGLCDGMAFIYATSTNPPISFIWNTGATTPYIQNLCAGTYTVTVADSLCSLSETVIIGAILGCTDSTALNYNALAALDDGSCIYCVYGCMDTIACNYDLAATCDDGSCLIPDGCTDMTACNYDPAALCDDGSCLTDYGCTDPLATNYDASATCDDGSSFLWTLPGIYRSNVTSCNDTIFLEWSHYILHQEHISGL